MVQSRAVELQLQVFTCPMAAMVAPWRRELVNITMNCDPVPIVTIDMLL